ncbi:MAG: hypothetical protein JWO36_2400 [Myxococcales bacterium]|nr:hypothetical protein [Myxococcales bacterium]
MERRFAVLARTCRQALIALVLVASPAIAGPKGGPAKVHFDRGVAAYSKGDFVTASEALGKSFALKPDPETLFAWAQAERRLDHCGKALELYAKLLKFRLPPANKDAVKTQIAECKDVIAAAQKPEPVLEPKPAPEPEKKPDVKIEAAPEPTPEPKPEPKLEPARAIRTAPQPVDQVIEGRAWWKDPVGDSLLGLGFAGLGAGAVFIVLAHNSENQKQHTTSYPEYVRLDDEATSRGQIGVISLVSGGVFVATSFAWFATHREHDRRGAVISGWCAPGTGGLVVTGAF